jgi:glycosidase
MNRVLIKCSMLVVSLLISFHTDGQKKSHPFQHVEPAFWWVGMKNKELQLLFHNNDANVGSYEAVINYDGVSLKRSERTDNPHYLFLTLEVSTTAKPGKVPIAFTYGKKKFVYEYELKSKSAAEGRILGFNSSDVMYLVMPDRFSNGDLGNDTIPGMYQGTHRDQGFARHGGDLKGISDHLDYVKDLGVTALWLNPVLENNQKRHSYHGYAITDLYQVDKRFGTNDDYLAFINKCHGMGLKVIQDMVLNHIGDQHWLMKDLPSNDWIHQFPTYTSSNYRGGVIFDPHRSKQDAMIMSNGWFDTTMPDVNQQNAMFAKYLIQNSLWWIEYAGIDGIRMDTYMYPDKKFMTVWANTVLEEYPGFNILGEVWLNTIPATAYWQKGSRNTDGYQSGLPCLTDFPLYGAIPKALTEAPGWDTGITRLYEIIAQDAAYPDAAGNLVFLDNHDVTRFYRSIGNDLSKLKMALIFQMTTRGIPQLYYGTEILMDGDAGNHSELRKDFPGGWADDQINVFSRRGLTADQISTIDFMKKLLNWRKSKTVIHTGKLTQYIPKDNIYVYFRSNGAETVMVVMNRNDMSKKLDTRRFAENMQGFTSAKNVMSDENLGNISSIELAPNSAIILELNK